MMTNPTYSQGVLNNADTVCPQEPVKYSYMVSMSAKLLES